MLWALHELSHLKCTALNGLLPLFKKRTKQTKQNKQTKENNKPKKKKKQKKPRGLGPLRNLTKNPQMWTSLVVQWLRIRLPMQGTWVQSLGQEDPTCRRATKPTSHNCWARAPQLLKPACSRACVPQLLSPHAATTEAHAPRARAPQQEKPLQWEARALQRRVALTRRN